MKKHIHNPEQLANFYLSETLKGSGRYWWQTMAPSRMNEIWAQLVQSRGVTDGTKERIMEVYFGSKIGVN